MTVASEQNATTGAPLTRPTAASMPESSSGVMASKVPSSSNARNRCTGWRGSWSRGGLVGLAGVAGAAGASAVWVMCSLSGTSEGDRDVGAAEAERVVQGGDVALREVAWLGGDVELHLRVLVVEVDRRGDHPVVQGEHGRDRLEGAGATEQVAGHRLGARDHDLAHVGAEGGVEHQALGDVTLRCRRRVRVDVHDRVAPDL